MNLMQNPPNKDYVLLHTTRSLIGRVTRPIYLPPSSASHLVV